MEVIIELKGSIDEGTKNRIEKKYIYIYTKFNLEKLKKMKITNKKQKKQKKKC
jgi:hypothetical protein